MELTPHTLRAAEFHARLRGYDMAEVDTFLNEVAAALEELLANIAHGADAAAWRPTAMSLADRLEHIRIEMAVPKHGSRDLEIRAEELAATILQETDHQSVAMVQAAEAAEQDALARLDQLRQAYGLTHSAP